MVTGCIAGFLAARPDDPLDAGIVVGLLVLAGMGFADDLRPQSVKFRLCVQFLAGVALVSELPPDTAFLWPIYVLFVVGQVNASNFMDGINGITSLSVIVACFWYAYVGHSNGVELLLLSAVTLGTATAAFGGWNLAGKVFLGDVGSYFIGGTLAVMALMAWKSGVDLLSSLAPLLVLIVDTAGTLVRRLAAGQRLGAPHRDHVYQRLTQSGRSHVAIASLVAACARSSPRSRRWLAQPRGRGQS